MTTIDIAQIEGLTLAQNGDTIIAASLSAKSLIEGQRAAVPYIPLENTLAAAHQPSWRTTHCPYKGNAAYYDVCGVADRAWIYYDPIDAAAEIAGCVAYYPDGAAVTVAPVPKVSADAEAVLHFWFEETDSGQHFKQDDAFDALIAERFGGLFEKAVAGTLGDWADHPQSALALIILLDQFSRNLFRDDPRAFAQDAKALRLARQMVARGFDLALPKDQRAFAYMPAMHDETIDGQNESVRLFTERLPGSGNVQHALWHRDEIHRHGRFRGRDKALSRSG